MKKGQTALEYLITYGWAILVILVVLAVLWYYGIFNPSRWAGEQVGSFSTFNVMDHKFSNTELQMVLANKGGKDVNVTGVIVKLNGVEVNDTSNINAGTVASQVTVKSNAQDTVTVGLNDLGGNTGDIMSLSVTIVYDTLGPNGLTGKADATTMNLKVA